MHHQIDVLDWLVIGAYLLAMLILAIALGRGNRSEQDYYLSGRNLPPWSLAISVMATQCSTNSLLGAPAFVGFVIGGGLIWLQYELAVPLAMIVLAALFLPVYRSGVISIYAFLEQRLGREARQLASACFLVFRGVATGVTVYGVASLLALVAGIDSLLAVLLLMGVTVLYDVLGGMRAVVISDVIQMIILLVAVIAAVMWLTGLLVTHEQVVATRADTLLNDWGLASGNNYGFWPMLFGGLFLYAAYYGCDQSQAQRLLSAHDERAMRRILMINGLARFPVVALYCVLGLGLAAYASEHAHFLEQLPVTVHGSPNLNLVFPAFAIAEFPPGLVGLVIVGLFAAAMSSIDSALNSLSASTLEDFMPHHQHGTWLPKLVTLGWGLGALAFSFAVEYIAPTVLEAVNRISSMANGSLLALFIIAAAFSHWGQRAAIIGFLAGLSANAGVWHFLPGVSWLWWNVIGCITALMVARLLSGRQPGSDIGKMLSELPLAHSVVLGMGALLILTLLIGIQQL